MPDPSPDLTALLPAEVLDALMPGAAPVSGHDDPHGDLRVFALQYRIDLAHAQSAQTYRAAMRALMDEYVVPHLVPGRPTLVVYPEAIGLLVLAVGERGAAFREAAGQPIAPPDPAGPPAALLGAMMSLAAASVERLGAYAGLFGPEAIASASALFLANTDTAARVFSQTFSDIARDYGVWVVAGNYQPPFRESADPADVAAFGEEGAASAFVATTPAVTNATFLWGPQDVAPTAPAPDRNLLFRNEKVPLTAMELDLLGITPGASEGEDAARNAGWTDVAGFRVGFATSLPAFAYGHPFGERPEGFDPLADVAVSYAAAQDALGVDVMIQADANPGAWAVYTQPELGGTGAWQPLEWMSSVWRAVADPTVGFRYNVTPMMTGNLLDVPFDGQSSIMARDRSTGSGSEGPLRSFVGTGALAGGDLPEYAVYAGDKPEFLALAPWVAPDGPREALSAVSWALSPGSGTPLENRYVQTALYADLRRPA